MIFKKLDISDKENIENIINPQNYKGSEFIFPNLYNWGPCDNLEVCIIDKAIFVRQKQPFRYSYPLGQCDPKKAIDLILSHEKENKEKLEIWDLNEEQVELVKEIYPDKFEFIFEDNYYDYIYSQEKLSTLSGKKLHSKRNHINKFLETYEYEYERITKDNIKDVKELEDEWSKENECYIENSLDRELHAVNMAIKNFFLEDLVGGILRVNKKVVAITFGHEISNDTFDVMVEKALKDYDGAYTMINNLFVKNELGKYQYINREDDTGDEGLRQAKESYHPDILYKRYKAVPIKE